MKDRGIKMISKAVIMAGGEGKRLRPLTDHVPKPLVEIGGKPLIQILIEHLRDERVRDITIAINYKGELIKKCFGDGRDLAVKIGYTRERKSMGTAGPLSLMRGKIKEPFYLVNGDILTTMRFSELGRHHLKKKADITVGVIPHEISVPYGVVQTQNGQLLDIAEKPMLRFLIVSGIYAISPSVLEHIPRSKYLDMPDFINILLKKRCHVSYFLIKSCWMDVGTSEDLQRAQRKVLEWGLLSQKASAHHDSPRLKSKLKSNQ